MLDLFDLQPWAILAAAVAGMLIGAVWYSPLLFGNAWMNALGKTTDELGPQGAAIAGSIVSCLLSALGLAVFTGWFGIETAGGGAMLGGFAGLTLVATAMLSDSLYSGSGWRLYFIQTGYRVTGLVVMGALLGGWPA
jgi:hypothetical protein